jgi:hypothetical protein
MTCSRSAAINGSIEELPISHRLPTPNTQTPSTKFLRPDNPCVMLPLALCDALESPHDDHRGEDGPRIPGDADAPRSCGILEA